MKSIYDYKTTFEVCDDCLQIGIPALTLKTAAKIAAITLHYGNNEQLTHSPHFLADCYYIQQKYHIQGGEIPDKEFAQEFKHYEQELRNSSQPPQWAKELMKNMYSINL